MAWRIQFRGEVAVFSPEGRMCEFPTRKSAALIALLALEENRQASYAQIGSWLWPEHDSSKVAVNVRQAVAIARRTIGSENLRTARQMVSLAEEFEYESDLASSSSAVLFQGFQGEHLDSLRNKFQIRSEQISAPGGLPGAFIELLRWYSENDGERMLEMMRADLGLSLNLGTKILSPLIAKGVSTEPLHKMKGWSCFWEGYCRMNTDTSGAASLLRKAAQFGLNNKDNTLAVEAYLWATCAHILAGQMDQAARTLTLGRNVATHVGDASLIAATQELRATLLLHTGNYRQAVHILRETSESDSIGKIQWASNVASVAFYEACAGEERKALQHLDKARIMASETKLVRIELICDLAEAYLTLSCGGLADAATRFRKLGDTAHRQECVGFEIYGLEGLALALLRQKEEASARRHLNDASSLRKRSKLRRTVWDSSRLKEANVYLRT